MPCGTVVDAICRCHCYGMMVVGIIVEIIVQLVVHATVLPHAHFGCYCLVDTNVVGATVVKFSIIILAISVAMCCIYTIVINARVVNTVVAYATIVDAIVADI